MDGKFQLSFPPATSLLFLLLTITFNGGVMPALPFSSIFYFDITIVLRLLFQAQVLPLGGVLDAVVRQTQEGRHLKHDRTPARRDREVQGKRRRILVTV
jgi:hypothetical protein